MDINLFDFDLPVELIAQFPLGRRDESRLMIVDRKSGSIRHSVFKKIVEEIPSGSIMVFNNSRVISCRLLGRREGGGRCEVFVHRIINEKEFYSFLRPHNKFKKGDIIEIDGIKVFSVLYVDKENYDNRLRLICDGSIYEIMKQYGHIPLPPYIKRGDIKGLDDIRYQTIYSSKDGAVASPTAGLHFTEEIMGLLAGNKVSLEFITLYVGIGTFAPVKVKNILEHKIHSEDYEIEEGVAERINRGILNGLPVIAVGTTTLRALESNYLLNRRIVAGRFSTDIFIYPGFTFNVVRHLVTNFHLPRSTLFMLVSAFAGRELMMYAYSEAIKERYRFFSYGDAMLIT